MKLMKKPWFVPIVLTIVILVAGSYFTKHLVPKAEALPESEIRKQLEDIYGGKVEQLSLEGTVYEAELSRNKDLYVAKIDAETGKVLSLIQTKEVIEEEGAPVKEETPIPSTLEPEKIEQPVQNNVQPDKVTTEPTQVTPSKPSAPEKNVTSPPKTTPTPPKKETPTVLISEKKAIQIALGQVKGEVDDVDFVKSSEGGYYLVEIEDDQDDETIIQIHAISGKIMSVTRDD